MLTRIRRTLRRGPQVSLVIIVYRMADQADRTLHSLSTAYQLGVSEADYEVIVVENSSDAPLGEERAVRHGPQFRYFYREESSRSPVHAASFGFAQCRASMVGLMIDGARMVTPGVLQNVLRATRMLDAPVVSVPGYHLGRAIQQEAVDSGYDEQVEAGLLAKIDWPSDGYALFDVGCLSGSCAGGFFRPIPESNCLWMPRWLFDEIGGLDPRFDLPGGGNINLDLYRRACDHPQAELVLLPGEGAFHQFHGGITTNVSKKDPERQRMMTALNEQYRMLRGDQYSPPQKEALYLGRIPPQAMRFVQHSAERVQRAKARTQQVN